MSEMPNTMKLGMAAAFIGAIIAFFTMAQAWNGSVDSLTLVGVCMATAMIFFAVAGCFSTYSPVPGSTAVVLSALAIAFPFIAAIYGAMLPIYALFLVLLGVVCIFCANLPSTKDYIETNRVI
jgi:hypothetical protein